MSHRIVNHLEIILTWLVIETTELHSLDKSLQLINARLKHQEPFIRKFLEDIIASLIYEAVGSCRTQ